jgi:hypothetical protein
VSFDLVARPRVHWREANPIVEDDVYVAELLAIREILIHDRRRTSEMLFRLRQETGSPAAIELLLDLSRVQANILVIDRALEEAQNSARCPMLQ